MKYFKTYNQFLNEGKENLDENLLDNIAKLDTLLLYSPNIKAQQEWEKTADYYLGKQEYWDQLDPMDVMNALEDAWLIMKKYNIKESVNEAKTYKKGDKLKIKLKNGKTFDVVFDSYSRTKGVALGKFKDRSGEYDTKPFNLDTIVESVNEARYLLVIKDRNNSRKVTYRTSEHDTPKLGGRQIPETKAKQLMRDTNIIVKNWIDIGSNYIPELIDEGYDLNEELYDFVRDIESAMGKRAPRWQIEEYLGRKLSNSELSALGLRVGSRFGSPKKSYSSSIKKRYSKELFTDKPWPIGKFKGKMWDDLPSWYKEWAINNFIIKDGNGNRLFLQDI